MSHLNWCWLSSYPWKTWCHHSSSWRSTQIVLFFFLNLLVDELLHWYQLDFQWKWDVGYIGGLCFYLLKFIYLGNLFQTSSGKGGAYLYDIHFWIGKDTSQVGFFHAFAIWHFSQSLALVFHSSFQNSYRMKPELLQSRLLSLMQSLEGVQFSTENFKVMNLTSFCHTSNHALFRWREVLLLDSKNVRMKSLKQDSMFVGGNELLGWSRYPICLFIFWIYAFPPWNIFSFYKCCMLLLRGWWVAYFVICHTGTFCSVFIESWWCVYSGHWE